jgi:asparagine synthase (glutamine-hydrolysing)
VLEFAASLPQSYKVSGWRLKRILKAALEESVPREILNRKKTGFPVPYDSWLRGVMKEFVFNTVQGQNSSISTYFDRTKIENLLQAHQEGRGYSKEVFSLLVLELWHKAFAGERDSAHAR